MRFYFCDRFINTDADEKKVKQDMYAALSYFRGSNDHIEYEEWESNFEAFFCYFILTSEQKYHYVQMKQLDRLIGGKKQPYWQSVLVCLTKSFS